MQKDINKTLREMIVRIDNEINNLVVMAESLRDDYLDWWNPKRELKLVMKPAHQTHRQAETGQLRPLIRKRKNINKWYLEWTTEHCHKVKKINSSWSKSITPTKAQGYTKQLLARNSDAWEEDRAWSLEEQWKPIRAAINSLHKCKTEINKQIRKGEKDAEPSNQI